MQKENIYHKLWYAVKRRVVLNKGRIALEVISIAKGATGWIVPDGCGFASLEAAAAQGSLTLPTTGNAGEVLFVYNGDDAATTTVEVAAGKTAMFAHNGTAWVKIAVQV